MKFKAIGSNRDTGARMVLEFEAESKAAAERKATQSGMNVNSVQDISDGDVEHAGIVAGGASRRKVTGMHPIMKLIILVAIIAIAWFVVWPMVRARMG
jgi:hypothetical protein